MTARAPAIVVWVAAVCAGLSCGSPAPSNGRMVSRQIVTATGGGLASTPNGKFKVQVPPGAVYKDTTITIQQIDSPGGDQIGPVYEVGPTGTMFLKQVTLAFSFSGLPLNGADPTTLHVATYSGGKWVPVTSQVDRASSIVTGQITHLSKWTLIVYTDVVPPEPDASTGDMDAGADVGSGGGGEAGSSAGADGGASDAAAGAGGKAGAGAGGQSGGAGGAGGKAGAGGGGQSGGAGGGGQGGATGGSGGATGGSGGATGGSGGATGGSGGATGGSGGATGGAGGATGGSGGATGGAGGDTGQGGAGGAGGDTGQGGAAGQDDAGAPDGDQDSALT
jgi:hypothetical protein